MKFVAWVESAEPLLARAGMADRMDAGFFRLDGDRQSCEAFIAACRALRFWEREISAAR